MIVFDDVRGESEVVLVPFKYNLITQQILNLVKDNFGQPNQPKQVYRLEVFVASRFVLSFPNLQGYNEALNRIKEELTSKFGHEPWITQSVRNLQFAINFPTYYSVYKENKALIISILGEPIQF